MSSELKRWHDWTDPDFFVPVEGREVRFWPLFLRQLLPVRWQRTRLTVSGWMLIVVAMGIGSAAYNTASNILFMTLSLLLSCLILSGILSLINFRKLQWRLNMPTYLKAAEVGVAEVVLSNGKSIFPSMSLCCLIDSTATETTERLYLQSGLRAGEAMKLEWTFIPKRRGLFNVCLSGVESQFPFGFLRKTIGVSQEEKVLVWPARINYSFRPAPGGYRFLSGVCRRNVGLGSDLLNLRPYERGDPPRLVHWKATARMRRLMIRQLAQEGERGFHIYVNPDALQWSAALFEVLCSLACSLAEDLFHVGRLESVIIVGDGPIAVRSIRELHDFFDRMALLERSERSVASYSGDPSHLITFRPQGAEEICIYVGENKAGQTHN